MVILLNLHKPLVSKIKVNERIQHVEKKSLPAIYFACGHFGHLKDNCPSVAHHVQVRGESQQENQILKENNKDSDMFGPWMVVNQRNGRLGRKLVTEREERKVMDPMGFRFNVLHDSRDRDGNNNRESNPTDSGNLKGKGVTIYNNALSEDELDPIINNGQNQDLRIDLLPIDDTGSILKVGKGRGIKILCPVNPMEAGSSSKRFRHARPITTGHVNFQMQRDVGLDLSNARPGSPKCGIPFFTNSNPSPCLINKGDVSTKDIIVHNLHNSSSKQLLALS